MSSDSHSGPQQRKVRRNTIILVCIAIAVYGGFILAGVVRSGGGA